MSKKFSIKNRLYSFKYAFKGLKLFIQTQHNAWIHIALLITALISGFYFKLTTIEWIALSLVAGLVFVAEILNTSIEFLTDYFSSDINEQAEKVKDLAAAAVLLASVVAFVVGLIIFLPKILNMF